MSTQRLATQANFLLATLHFARSEAVKRNTRVVLCKTADGSSCATSGGWQQGWIVFADANNNAQRDLDEPVLRTGNAAPTGYVLNGNTQIANYVSYTPVGVAKRTSGAFQAGTFTLCQLGSDTGDAREILVSITGRPRVASVTLATCP